MDNEAVERMDLGFVATVDSGAAGSVMPASVCPDAETTGPTHVRYRTANGSYLPNRGMRWVITEQGAFCFGLADVTKPLLSVGEIVAEGHVVVMRPDGGYIAVRRPNGEARRIPMKLQKGVFTVELKPLDPVKTTTLSPVDEETEVESAPFQGPAVRL